MSYRARQKNGNQKRSDKRACAVCHARVGFGLKASAFMLGTSIVLPRKARLSAGMAPRVAASGKSAYKPAMGYKPAEPCPIKAQADAFRSEHSKLNRMDAHWFGGYQIGHPECARWIGSKMAARRHSKLKHDPHYRIRRSLSCRVWKVLKSVGYPGDTMELIGCTKEKLFDHIESKMRDGMTWENYGTHWHVDHVRPCASFDLSDRVQARMCFHYSNLQPLLAVDNWRKNSLWRGSRIRKPRNSSWSSILRIENM